MRRQGNRPDTMAYEATVTDGVLQVSRPETRWLSTGYAGGFEPAPAVYNVSVPEGWDRTDVATYARERRHDAGFGESGPALLTGVDMTHARGARLGSVVAFATVGLSNPATLPLDLDDTSVGTVNLIVATTETLTRAAQANLVSVTAETKAATLLALADVPGTTSDAVIIGSATDGSAKRFTGSATAIGDAARSCVRDAIHASFNSRYEDDPPPASVDAADYGARANRRASVFDPCQR